MYDQLINFSIFFLSIYFTERIFVFLLDKLYKVEEHEEINFNTIYTGTFFIPVFIAFFVTPELARCPDFISSQRFGVFLLFVLTLLVYSFFKFFSQLFVLLVQYAIKPEGSLLAVDLEEEPETLEEKFLYGLSIFFASAATYAIIS